MISEKQEGGWGDGGGRVRVLFFQRIERSLILEILVQNSLKQKLIQTINMQLVLLQTK